MNFIKLGLSMSLMIAAQASQAWTQVANCEALGHSMTANLFTDGANFILHVGDKNSQSVLEFQTSTGAINLEKVLQRLNRGKRETINFSRTNAKDKPYPADANLSVKIQKDSETSEKSTLSLSGGANLEINLKCTAPKE